MRRLLQGEGWVELTFALIAVSLFAVWLVVVYSSRLNSLTLWEAWQSQRPPAPAARVVASTPTAPAANTGELLVGR